MLEYCYYYLDVFLTPVLILLILIIVGTNVSPVIPLLSDNVQALSLPVHDFLPRELPQASRSPRHHLGLQVVAFRVVGEDHVIKCRLDASLVILVPQLVLGRGLMFVPHYYFCPAIFFSALNVNDLSVHFAHDKEFTSCWM
jgi:hypothetical protein